MAPLLNKRQVAALLGVSPKTVFNMIADKRLPEPLRSGPNIMRWTEEDIAGAIERMRAPTNEEKI